jgi:hypothetical protein
MDAVHDLPELLLRWSEGDEDLLRQGLKDYDRRWPGGRGLLDIYDEAALTHTVG